jgi:hypothetical protein
MKMKTLLAILLLLFPVVAWATDGDPLNGAAVTRGSFEGVPFVFCDAKVEASANTCAEFDLQTAGRGMPDYILFSLDSATNCTAGYSVVVNGHTLTGLSGPHAWTTLNATNSAARIDGPVHRFIAGVTVDAGCDTAATGLTVNMILYFRKD